jgi:hypothetical protein
VSTGWAIHALGIARARRPHAPVARGLEGALLDAFGEPASLPTSVTEVLTLVVKSRTHGKGVLPEWHEVKQNIGCVAWDLAAVGSHHASPVCLRINIPIIVQEVTRWFRT